MSLAVTLAALVTVVGCLAVLLWGLGRMFAFFQPVLLPIAVAGVMAFLLNPIVGLLIERLRWSRHWAVLAVLGGFLLVATLGVLWLVPVVWEEGGRLVNLLPEYVSKARGYAEEVLRNYQERYAGNPVVVAIEQNVREKLPELGGVVLGWLQRSLSGVFGAVGFFVSFLLVPVYLFYFLSGAVVIRQRWHEFLPLRASAFKSEIVSVLLEIHQYLVAYFRGQVLVSFLNGLLTWIGLQIIGLEFALFIGVLLAVVGLIPILGIVISAVPALLISFAQGGGGWQLPLLVVVVFSLVQVIDSLFITPKIVGDTVGLHPMTVMVSIIFWGLLLDGLIGALLAVPLTATTKVLLKRYVWNKPPGEIAESEHSENPSLERT